MDSCVVPEVKEEIASRDCFELARNDQQVNGVNQKLHLSALFSVKRMFISAVFHAN